MASYRARIHSPSDPRTVFAYLSRFDRAAQWDPGVSTGTMLTDEPVALGSRFRLDVGFLGRSMPLEYEVVGFDPRGRIVLRAETASIRSTDTITVAAPGADDSGADDSGALVLYEAVLEGKGLLRHADPFLAFVFRRIGDRAAAGLRSHLNSLLAS